MLSALNNLHQGYNELQEGRSPGALLHDELRAKSLWRLGKENREDYRQIKRDGFKEPVMLKAAEMGFTLAGAAGSWLMVPVDLLVGSGSPRSGTLSIADPSQLMAHLHSCLRHPTDTGLAGLALGVLAGTIFATSGLLGATVAVAIGLPLAAFARDPNKTLGQQLKGFVQSGVDIGVLGLGSVVVMVSGVVPAAMGLGAARLATGVVKAVLVGALGGVGAAVGVSVAARAKKRMQRALGERQIRAQARQGQAVWRAKPPRVSESVRPSQRVSLW